MISRRTKLLSNFDNPKINEFLFKKRYQNALLEMYIKEINFDTVSLSNLRNKNLNKLKNLKAKLNNNFFQNFLNIFTEKNTESNLNAENLFQEIKKIKSKLKQEKIIFPDNFFIDSIKILKFKKCKL